DAAAEPPVEAELARDRADRTGGVDRQGLLQHALGLRRDPLHQLHVPALVAVLARDLEKPRRARVDRLVQRVADAGDAALLRAEVGDDRAGDLRQRAIAGVAQAVLE